MNVKHSSGSVYGNILFVSVTGFRSQDMVTGKNKSTLFFLEKMKRREIKSGILRQLGPVEPGQGKAWLTDDLKLFHNKSCTALTDGDHNNDETYISRG